MSVGRLIVGSSLNSSDIFYASGFYAPDPFIYFSSGRNRGIVVSPLEFSRAVNESKKGIKVFLNEEKNLKESVLKTVRTFHADIWEVPSYLPYSIADFLIKSNIKLKCVEDCFFSERGRKKAGEIEKIEHALKIAEKAMSRAVKTLQSAQIDSHKRLVSNGEYLSSEKIKIVIEEEIVKNGAVTFGTIVSCGKKSAEPHNTGSGPLYAGMPIIIDIFPHDQKTLYWGDLTRTFVKGKAHDTVKKAFFAVKEARDRTKVMAQSGVSASKLHMQALKIFEKHGFKTGRKKNGGNFGFFHGLGHGIGLEVHEFPNVSNKSGINLVAGNVITIEPGLYYPEWGGVRLEDMIVVGKNSSKTLTRYPTFLEIP